MVQLSPFPELPSLLMGNSTSGCSAGMIEAMLRKESIETETRLGVESWKWKRTTWNESLREKTSVIFAIYALGICSISIALLFLWLANQSYMRSADS